MFSVISPILGWPLIPQMEANCSSRAYKCTTGSPGQDRHRRTTKGFLGQLLAWLLPPSGILRKPVVSWVSGNSTAAFKCISGRSIRAHRYFLNANLQKKLRQIMKHHMYSTDKSFFQDWQAIFPHNSFLWCSDLVLWKVQFLLSSLYYVPLKG